MSNYIKLHGHHEGVSRPGHNSIEKTLHLRVSDIEEICVVPNGEHRYKESITKEEYEKNKGNSDYYVNDGSNKNSTSDDTYWKYLPTALITMGHASRANSSGENLTLRVRENAADIVDMIDKATVDLEVRKALAVEAALNPPKKL